LTKESSSAKVGIVMGSDSDFEVMKTAAEVLKKFDIPFEITVASAHRTPARAAEFAAGARDRGVSVIIGYRNQYTGLGIIQRQLPRRIASEALGK